jgi:hypothetical protein
MGFSHVQGQKADATSSVTALQIVLGSNPTPGNLVCVGVEIAGSNAGLSIKDANNNTYQLTPNSPASCGSATVSLAYLLSAPANASATINISWTNAAAYDSAWADEFSPSGGAAVFDKDAVQSNGTASGYTINLPSITPSGSNELLYGTAAPDHSITAPAAGATLGAWTGAAGGIDSSTGCTSEYCLSASSATAADYTDNTSGDSYCAMAMAFYSFPPDEDSSMGPRPQAADPTVTVWG